MSTAPYCGAPPVPGSLFADTTWPWGLSQLQDQQLGGLIMWVVGGFLLVIWALIVLADYLAREPAKAA